MRRRITLVTGGIVAGLALLLGAEIVYAILAERLPASEPFDLYVRPGASTKPLRIAWVGDSVAAGVGASAPDAALPRLVSNGLGQPVELHVFAVSGARATGALEEQMPLVESLASAPDVIIIEIGANDVTHLAGGGGFRRDYDRILARATATGAQHVIALGLPAFGSTPRFLQPLRAIVAWRSRRLDAEVRASAAQHGLRYVDIAGMTEPGFAADPEGTHAEDRFHPNDAGYRLWAKAVLSVLGPVLRLPG